MFFHIEYSIAGYELLTKVYIIYMNRSRVQDVRKLSSRLGHIYFKNYIVTKLVHYITK